MKTGKPLRDLLIFTTLVITVSWGAILLIFGADIIPVPVERQQEVGMAILLGPSLVSIALILPQEGIRGLHQLGKSLVKWKVRPKWYGIAILLAPLTTLITQFIVGLLHGHLEVPLFSTGGPVNLLTLALIGGITVAFFEELGWTGYATPRLLDRFKVTLSGFILGLVWGAWHFILFWEQDSFRQLVHFLLLMAQLFAWLPAYRILMTWVYKRTESLLIAILMHASLVASLVLLDPVISGEALLGYIVIRAAILWAIVLIVLWTRQQIEPLHK